MRNLDNDPYEVFPRQAEMGDSSVLIDVGEMTIVI